MLTLNYKCVAGLSMAFMLSGCLATQKHVKTVSDPLDRRLGGLEAKSREIDGTLSTHEKGIASADERAKSADQRAADAAREAKSAHEKIGPLGEQTSSATAAVGKTASEARIGVGGFFRTGRRVGLGFGGGLALISVFAGGPMVGASACSTFGGGGTCGFSTGTLGLVGGAAITGGSVLVRVRRISEQEELVARVASARQ